MYTFWLFDSETITYCKVFLVKSEFNIYIPNKYLKDLMPGLIKIQKWQTQGLIIICLPGVHIPSLSFFTLQMA